MGREVAASYTISLDVTALILAQREQAFARWQVLRAHLSRTAARFRPVPILLDPSRSAP